MCRQVCDDSSSPPRPLWLLCCLKLDSMSAKVSTRPRPSARARQEAYTDPRLCRFCVASRTDPCGANAAGPGIFEVLTADDRSAGV